MRGWLILLAGLIVWAAHFFILYGIGEFGGEGTGPRIAVLAITLACLLANGGLALLLRRLPRADDHEHWRARSALGGILLGSIGIVWQALPALFPA